MTSEPNDPLPWRPETLYYGVTIQFVEPNGQSYTASVGSEIHGSTLEKLVRQVNREALARVIGLGFHHEKHKHQNGG